MEDGCPGETAGKLSCQARVQQTSHLLHLPACLTWGVSLQNAVIRVSFSCWVDKNLLDLGVLILMVGHNVFSVMLQSSPEHQSAGTRPLWTCSAGKGRR